jgi:hypothetical protein
MGEKISLCQGDNQKASQPDTRALDSSKKWGWLDQTDEKEKGPMCRKALRISCWDSGLAIESKVNGPGDQSSFAGKRGS